MLEKSCEGKCPYCESDGIDFGDWIDGDNEYEVFEYVCNSCGRTFRVVMDIEQISIYSYTEYEEIPLDKRTLFDKGK